MRNLVSPDRIRYYNSERREVAGMYANAWQGASDHKYHYAPPTYVEVLYLDGTNTSAENRKTQVLFTYANGAYLEMRYHIDEDDTKYTIYADVYLMTKDGSIKEQLGTPSLESSKQISQSLNSVVAYYTPSGIVYPSAEFPTEGNYGGGATLCGGLYTPKVTASPYERPAYNSDMEYNEFVNYYNSVGFKPCLNMEQINAALDDIITSGDDTPITPILPSEDTSEPGGGDDANPDYNPYGDPVDFAGLPTGGSAIATGFIRVYNPSPEELQALASELWGGIFVNTLEKLMNDPMEAIISLHSIPFDPTVGSQAHIRIGNYDSNVNAPTVTVQYYQINCGNISIPEHWASALDYSPYTDVNIFIPFVGVRPLQIDDVMNKVLTLKYNIDILTGSAIAMLKSGDSVLYTFNTQLHAEIPYTMSSYGRVVQSIISVAGTAIGAVAGGGAGASLGSVVGSALGTALSKHSDISRGGTLGGSVGVMGDFTPYLIIHRPIQSLASDFASKKGYPSNITRTLSSVSGYTVIDKIHLTNIDCTDTERDEIHALLKEGVIL